MIFKEKPSDFAKKVDVVACYIKCGDKFLLLERQPYKPQGGTWGLPAGKVGGKESFETALVREVYEETGINLQLENLEQYTSLYVRHNDYDFEYHTFSALLNEIPPITIRADEHRNYTWTTKNEAKTLSLIEDLVECNDLFL